MWPHGSSPCSGRYVPGPSVEPAFEHGCCQKHDLSSQQQASWPVARPRPGLPDLPSHATAALLPKRCRSGALIAVLLWWATQARTQWWPTQSVAVKFGRAACPSMVHPTSDDVIAVSLQHRGRYRRCRRVCSWCVALDKTVTVTRMSYWKPSGLERHARLPPDHNRAESVSVTHRSCSLHSAAPVVQPSHLTFVGPIAGRRRPHVLHPVRGSFCLCVTVWHQQVCKRFRPRSQRKSPILGPACRGVIPPVVLRQ